MNEMNIMFNLEKPELANKEILISVENKLEDNLNYKFLVGVQGIWTTLKESSATSDFLWKPDTDAKYSIMVQAKRKESKKSFDFFSKAEYVVGNFKEKLIRDIYIDKTEIRVGEKITLTVEPIKPSIMYRYWIHKDENWLLLKDYSTENVLTWSSKYSGKQEFLVECKNVDSKNTFDDFMKLQFYVKSAEPLEIKEFKCSTKELLAGSELVFDVESKYEDNRMVLYKFVKINSVGDNICLQDYSTEKSVSYVEENGGDYKLLCMAKDIYSLKEFDDRALIRYEVKDVPFDGQFEESMALEFVIDDINNTNVVIEDIILDKKNTVLVGEVVNVLAKATGGTSLRYSFIVSDNNSKIEKIEFGTQNFVNFTPERSGKFKLEIRVKDKYSNREYDCHSVVYIEALVFIPAKIEHVLMPTREYYLVGDTISLEVITENTKDTLVNYVLKINDHLVEQTNFVEHKNYQLKPKCSGTYLIELRAKNISSTKDYDCVKQIQVQVRASLPITDTKILCDKTNFKVNEAISFEAQNKGGKDVVYEYYLMEKGQWTLVQKFSKKSDYSFMPFSKGNSKLLVLSKNFYKSISYEDYDIMELEVL